MINARRRRSLGIAMATLALAGCSDPQDIKFARKSDAGATPASSSGQVASGAGGNESNLLGGSTGGTSFAGGGAGNTAGASGSASDLGDGAAAADDVALPVPTPAELGAVLFSADFEDGNLDSWKTYDGTLAIAMNGANGSAKSLGFRTTATGSIGKAVTAGSPSATRFAFESDIMFESGGQASLIFRVASPSAGGPDNLTAYGVGLDTGASSLWAGMFANKWLPLGVQTISVLPSTWYHLRIDVRPGKFTIFLDGQFVMETTDGSLLDPGMIGIRGDWGPMGDSGTAPEVLFDNIKQTAIVESDGGT
jgi:hypothetical protein